MAQETSLFVRSFGIVTNRRDLSGDAPSSLLVPKKPNPRRAAVSGSLVDPVRLLSIDRRLLISPGSSTLLAKMSILVPFPLSLFSLLSLLSVSPSAFGIQNKTSLDFFKYFERPIAFL